MSALDGDVIMEEFEGQELVPTELGTALKKKKKKITPFDQVSIVPTELAQGDAP
jgi:hypothetical protein